MQAYVELIERFGWKSYTILYEDNQGLVRLQELLKSPTQSDVRIQVRQLPIDDDYRWEHKPPCFQISVQNITSETALIDINIRLYIQAVTERYQERWRDTYRVRLFHGKNPTFSESSHASRNDDCLSQLSHNKSGKYDLLTTVSGMKFWKFRRCILCRVL